MVCALHAVHVPNNSLKAKGREHISVYIHRLASRENEGNDKVKKKLKSHGALLYANVIQAAPAFRLANAINDRNEK